MAGTVVWVTVNSGIMDVKMSVSRNRGYILREVLGHKEAVFQHFTRSLCFVEDTIMLK